MKTSLLHVTRSGCPFKDGTENTHAYSMTQFSKKEVRGESTPTPTSHNCRSILHPLLRIISIPDR